MLMSLFVHLGACLLISPHLLEPMALVFSSIQPDEHTKAQKEGIESEQFWELLGGKSEYPSQKIKKDGESDPHLFSCTFSNGKTICQHMFPLCFLNPRIYLNCYLHFLMGFVLVDVAILPETLKVNVWFSFL